MTSEVFIPTPPGKDEKAADHNDRPKVRVISSGGSFQGRGELHIDIHGLDSKELQLIEGALHGHQWVTCKDGRIANVPTFEQLPGPLEDEAMMPFWRRSLPDTEVQLSLFSFEPLPTGISPSIFVQSLCGHNYSEEKYKYQAAKLTRWGFVPLRSPRDPSGGFWELWYLMGLWAAKEELKLVVDTMDPFALELNTTDEWMRDVLGPPRKEPGPPKDEKERRKRELDAALAFLGRNVQFGTLDVSVQRMAMGIPD